MLILFKKIKNINNILNPNHARFTRLEFVNHIRSKSMALTTMSNPNDLTQESWIIDDRQTQDSWVCYCHQI
jgi:hypothetical protein